MYDNKAEKKKGLTKKIDLALPTGKSLIFKEFF
jgi:hypothetical protein